GVTGFAAFGESLIPGGLKLPSLESPKAAPQSPEQAPPSPDYVPGPEYPEYVAPSDDDIPVEDQPLPVDASPTALSPGCVVDSDLKEDPTEDPVDYPANEGDDDDDEEESSEDDDDDDECMAAPALPSPPPSSLSPWSSPLSRIPSPPLPLPSPPTRPFHTSLTYAHAPLSYRAAMVQLRAASPSTEHLLLSSKIPPLPLYLPFTVHRDDIPKADIPPQKRACFTAPTRRFEVEESLAAATARQTRHALTSSVNYGFIDTVDASIRATEGRVMTVVEEVNKRVTDLATT
ncbi:hypothetical protein Tco_0194385, partial [Tanacetum coccineum]